MAVKLLTYTLLCNRSIGRITRLVRTFVCPSVRRGLLTPKQKTRKKQNLRERFSEPECAHSSIDQI